MGKHPFCDTCYYYEPGQEPRQGPTDFPPYNTRTTRTGRCHTDPPSRNGFPLVVGESDWCSMHTNFWADLKVERGLVANGPTSDEEEVPLDP